MYIFIIIIYLYLFNFINPTNIIPKTTIIIKIISIIIIPIPVIFNILLYLFFNIEIEGNITNFR